MDDQNSQTPPSEAPDGAPDLDPQEVMTRAEARKLVAQRQELKAKNDALASEIEQLRAKQAAPPAPTEAPVTPDTADMPAWAAGLVAQNKALAEQVKATQEMFGEHRNLTARTAVEKEVLAKVPDGNKATVKALLGSLGVDFSKPGAAADALALLQEHHPIAMVDHTRGAQPRAPQVKPDGSIDASYFAGYSNFSDVPDAYKAAAMRDPKVFARLMGKGEGLRGDGLNI